MKKIISVILSVMMVLSLFAGCGGDSADGAKTMKIVMTANAHIDTELYFVNTKVYKAGK